MTAAIALLALIIEALVGYPDWLGRAIGHPVMWMGGVVRMLEHAFNREAYCNLGRRAAGGFAVCVLIGAAGLPAWAIEQTMLLLPFGALVLAVMASTLLAQRSLYEHVGSVAVALETEGLVGGRAAVAHIVGRDPESLDRSGVARAAIESLAENFSDAVVAPALWLAAAGLVGGTIYKAINTADSMTGHRTPRYEAFGFAAARLDDLVNLPASRLAGLLIVAAAAATRGASAPGAWRTLRKDAAHHRSPNAGYPEAAMAGALGIVLGGRRVYAGMSVDEGPIGSGRGELTVADIRAALELYRRADALLIALGLSVVVGVSLLR
jgi:adenosylcobinamide-phosphate synthase